jgi:hypothetical protein
MNVVARALDRWVIERSDRDMQSAKRVGDDGAKFVVLLAFFFGFTAWFATGRFFCQAPIWLFLMTVVMVSMRIDGNAVRRDLAKKLKEWQAERSEYIPDEAILEAYNLRIEQRKAIRAGELPNDGLSDFGRQCRDDLEFAARVRNDERSFDATFPDKEEGIFASEEKDKKIEAALRKKRLADAALKQLMSE